MLEYINIKNFRSFEKIEIKKLGKVNLFVGKNNAGKSALLESILLYVSHFSTTEILNLLSSRQETWEHSNTLSNRRNIPSPIRHLFRNHLIPNTYEEGFFISTNQHSVSIKVIPYVYNESENRAKRKKIEPDELENYDSDFIENFVVAEYISLANKPTKIILSVDDPIEIIRRKSSYYSEANLIPYQYVSTSGINDEKASYLWDSIALTDLEKEVITGLQLVDPNVVGLTFVENQNGRNNKFRIPLVKVTGHNEPLPLKSLGDGMSRIFQVILSLVCSKGGVFIVDEFENGLHWSVQESAWDLVFKLADKLNVQVFCSSHSRDCITGFQRAWSQHPEKGGFGRISKDNGTSQIKTYDLELLSDSIETDVEVR